MPPEPLPWERKDFFKERRHERPSEAIGPVSRWREPAPHNGFRGRPPGRGWRYHSTGSGRGFTPSRVNEKFIGDEGFRPSGYRMDGRYTRINRDNKGPFGQKDLRGHSWENGMLPNSSGRPYFGSEQRSVDDRGSFGQKDLKGQSWENDLLPNNSGRLHNGSDQRLVDDKGFVVQKDLRGKSWENGMLPNGSNRLHNGSDQSSVNDKGYFGKKDLKVHTWENSVLPDASGRLHAANGQRSLDDKGSIGQRDLRGKSCENGVLPNNSGRSRIGSDQSSIDDKGSFNQKDLKGHPWENVVRPNKFAGFFVGIDLGLVDDMLTLTSPSHLDFERTQDQLHSKDQYDKASNASDLVTGRRSDKENSLGLIDWKPLKWTRSGSLSSRGSGFSHSSCAKSTDSGEAKPEVPPRNGTPIQSSSGDAAVCVATSAVQSEDTGSRKKPRLKWGEGLAKFEKKKVEGPDDDSATKRVMVVCVGGEPSHVSNMADKSPRIAGFLECASPATPSSVACSSSPGASDNAFIRSANSDYDTYSSGSPNLLPQNHLEGSQERDFHLENMEFTSVANLSSLLTGLFQLDPVLEESSFVRSTAMNKLLVLKGETLKALEMTESEIDSLENELKKLISESSSGCPCPATSSSLNGGCEAKPPEELVASNTIPRPTRLQGLQLMSSGDVEMTDGGLEDDCCQVREEDVDTPTSKFILPLAEANDDSLCVSVKNNNSCADKVADVSGNLEKCPAHCSNEENTEGLFGSEGAGQLVASFCNDTDKALCDRILALNNDTAIRACEVFNKLLPSNPCNTDASRISSISSWKDDPQIVKMFAFRKRSRRFKERVITLKFRALQNLWREDLQLLLMKKGRAKSQKRLELSSRTPLNSYQKHRSSIRSRFSSTGGNLSLAPTTEIINLTSKLLSDSLIKPYRDSLKMPALILDKEEKIVSRFISGNGLVEDPCVVEKERAMINPWTKEEKETFMEKLASFGKDFKKIASFLDHKTTADCVEFYYKNHKSECFVKPKKKPELAKQGKSYSFNNYLVTSGKRWNRETNAASLDVLGEASAIAANADHAVKIWQEIRGNKAPRSDGLMERQGNHDAFDNERETEAADVLAGICGSMSSEAMSSCITSSFDRGESYKDLMNQKVGSDDDSCSDDSCGEIEPTHWTDQEKSVLIQAVSSYGTDFAMISRCVRTKSRDQCKVFFSKARKCLGLDTVRPRACDEGMASGDDNNGGGSDNEGVCVVKTGSVVCSEKSAPKMDQDMMLSDLNMNKLEKNNCTDPGVSGNMIIDDIVKGEPQLDLEGDLKMEIDVDNKPVIVSDSKITVLPSDTEEDRGNGEGLSSVGSVSAEVANDHGLSISCAEVETVHTGQDAMEPPLEEEQMVSVNNLNDRQDENQSGFGDLNCVDQDLHANGNASILAADSDTCMELGVSLKQELKVTLDLNPPLEPLGFSLAQDDCHVNANSVAEGVLSRTQSDFDRITEKLYKKSAATDNYNQHPSSPSAFGGHSLQLATNREMHGDMGFENLAPLNIPSKVDGNFHSDVYTSQECFLRKCNGSSDAQSSSVELSFQTQEHKRSHSRHHSWSSSDTEKPSRNGDVKLFGQILTHSSQQKQNNSSIPENEDKGVQNSKSSSKNLNQKSTSSNTVDTNSVIGKFDRNNYLGLENVPTRSFGFWDGNRIQTGFASLPDSAILLAKYPAAFGNFSSSSNIEQQALHSVVKSNDHNLNGVSVFSTREMSSGNGVVDYQLYRNQQDMLISEMQRRNGIGAFSSLRNSRGMSGTNVGISDPVAAIKMHYAKAEQYGGQTGNIMLEEESWRGKADLGR